MAEELVTLEQADAGIPVVATVNPFSESSWKDTEPEMVVVGAPVVEEKKPEEAAKPADSLTVDADGFLKETGWKSLDEAKAAKVKLDEIEKAPKPEPLKFANEDSEKFFNALREGKEDDLYNYMQTKRVLDRAEKLDVTKPKDAAEIIKLDLQYKNKDLTSDEVDYLFDKRYSIPEKPEQNENQTDEEYEKVVAKWEKGVKTIEKGMVIDAKMAKPELAKYKSQIILPEIPKAEATQKGPTQAELDAIEKGRQSYLQILEKDYTEFKGYSVKAKDAEVELPISYEVTDAERKAYKEKLQEFDVNEFFQNRWFQQDEKTGAVTPKVEQFMRDIYRLENSEKIDQKIANEAAAQMKAHLIKKRANVDVTSGDKNKTVVSTAQKSNYDEQVKSIWQA